MVEAEGAWHRHPAMHTGPGSLNTLRALEPLSHPPEEMPLGSPGPKHPNKLTGVWVAHVDMKLVQESFFFFQGLGSLGTLARLGLGARSPGLWLVSAVLAGLCFRRILAFRRLVFSRKRTL
eukprot:4266832-Pyramimonas_sp.AAC.1